MDEKQYLRSRLSTLEWDISIISNEEIKKKKMLELQDIRNKLS